MVSKFKFHAPSAAQENAQDESRTDRNCCIYGCPMPGHMLTSGNWNCRYHYGKNGDALAVISRILRTHPVEFAWHGKVLQFTIVDFLVGDVAKNAPHGLEPQPNQTFQEYKAFVKSRIEELLKSKVTVTV